MVQHRAALLLNCNDGVIDAGAAKPRKPRAKQEPWEDDETGAANGGAAAAAAAAPRVTAAGKTGAGHRGGGGRSSTSSYRGVTQHRYTLRWESHLWDPDAVRAKTAGSSRTKGRQVRALALFNSMRHA